MSEDRALAPAMPIALDEHAVNDIANPRSLVNMVPTKVREAIMRVPQEYLSMSPEDLLAEFKRHGWEPKPMDNRLRILFWKEYERVIELPEGVRKGMNMGRVYGELVSRQYFYLKYLADSKKVAWLLQVPTDYRAATEEALSHGINRIREILDLPMVNAKGIVDAKVAGVILDTVKFLDTRVKGAVVQKIQQANLNVNVDAKKSPSEPVENHDDMEALNARLRELENKASSALGRPNSSLEKAIIEAEVVHVVSAVDDES